MRYRKVNWNKSGDLTQQTFGSRTLFHFRPNLNEVGPRGYRRLAIEILQLLVGALVTIGGSLFAIFAVNSFGIALGLIHLSIGIAGIIGGIAFLLGKPRSSTLLLAINGLTIAYSTFSESIVQIQSLLPPFASTGSLVGTVIALIMSFGIIYLLLSNPSYSKTSSIEAPLDTKAL